MTVASGASMILSIAKEAPEKALMAAVIQRAVADARGGDSGALVWLGGDACLGCLIHLAPAGIDPRALQQRLLMKLEGFK